jgi:hypothetical protein
MTDWSTYRRAIVDRYVDALVEIGFRAEGTEPVVVKDHFVPALDREVPLQIDITDAFPYAPPKVIAEDGSGSASWHRDLDNALCLWSTRGEPGAPWMEPEALLERIEDWFLQDARGWPDDPPDLDLDRYWPPAPPAEMLVHSGLNDLAHGAPITVHRARGLRDVRELRPGRGKNRAERRAEPGMFLSLGELAAPPRNIAEILERCKELDYQAADRIRIVLEQGRVLWLVLRYERQGHPGALALRQLRSGDWGSVECAESSERISALRAGPDQAILRERSVCVIGVGAVGSFLVEELLRAGVGHIAAVDYERLRPGNIARHAGDPDQIGQGKAIAMKNTLGRREQDRRRSIEAFDEIVNPRWLAENFHRWDLMIDATGSAQVNRALFDIASLDDTVALSVALHGDGAIVRIDRAPIVDGEAWDPPEGSAGDTRVAQYEGGCGDPVSPTPPWCCVLAAALTCGVASGVLAGRLVPPTTRIALEA